MKILVRLPNWLGDVVMSTAFIRALKATYPEARIDVIVKKGLQDILSYCTAASHVFVYSGSVHSGLAGNRKFGKTIPYPYDLFFCLPDSFSSAWMGYATQSKTRVGYKKELRSMLLHKAYSKKKGLHRVEEYLDLLAQFSGKERHDFPVVLTQTNETRSPFLSEGKNLLFNINSEARSRRIPIGFAEQLVRAIRKKYDLSIHLSGGPGDVEHTAALAHALRDVKSVYNRAGKTSVKELLDMVSQSDLVLSTDSGVAHVGNAFGIKTLVLFGAGNEKNTRPYNPSGLRIARKSGLACAPCVSNTCKFGDPKCLTELDLGLVMDGLNQLMDA